MLLQSRLLPLPLPLLADPRLVDEGWGARAVEEDGAEGRGSKGAGVAGAGAGGAEARAHRGSAKLTPPPDSIYTFVVFDATQYVAAHLVCHLFVFLVFFLYLTVIVIA